MLLALQKPRLPSPPTLPLTANLFVAKLVERNMLAILANGLGRQAVVSLLTPARPRPAPGSSTGRLLRGRQKGAGTPRLARTPCSRKTTFYRGRNRGAAEQHQAAGTFCVCRECGYNTGKHPQWYRRKYHHISTCHPELKIAGQMDERTSRRPQFVPYSAACCWRCPAPGCGLGVLANEATPKQRQTARLSHGNVHASP